METLRSPAPTSEFKEADDVYLAETRLRVAETVRQQIETKELLTAVEFCEALKEDIDWLEDALGECRVFSITGPGGLSYYPAFFVDPVIRREHIEAVMRRLAHLHPLSQYLFYTTAMTSQDGTPLDALRAGQLDEVITAALQAAVDVPRRVPSIVEVLSEESWPPKNPLRHAPSESFTDMLNGVTPRRRRIVNFP
jgi:hypothetical protein